MKVFRSLPQELEDEALADFDRQVDQEPFNSEFLTALSSDERQGKYREWYQGMFNYVFGYAQAKGWTDIEKRIHP